MLMTACKTKLVLAAASLALSLNGWSLLCGSHRAEIFPYPSSRPLFPCVPWMCSEQQSPLPGPGTHMLCCPTFQTVPPKDVSFGPCETGGESAAEEQLVFGNSWTLMLDTTQMGTLHKCKNSKFCSGCANHIIPMGQAKSVHTRLRPRDESGR